jgi:hypothetical protein
VRDKINELATTSKSNDIRDLYRRTDKFMRGYQPRRSKDDNGNPLADPHNIVKRWKNSFSQHLMCTVSAKKGRLYT